jgi:cytochrome c-type biogenesis protein
MLATLFFAFVAGTLTVFSPCVLPVLPMVLGVAASKGRLGPVFLALGLTVSFVTIGMFVALFGFAIGLDEGVFRQIAAVLMIAVGAVLLLPVLQTRLATAGGPLSGWINDRFASDDDTGNGGPFGLGLLMGAIWAPCVGPTLGAASVMAAQGENLIEVTLTMVCFGIGSALPLLLLGLLSREALTRWRGKMLSLGGGLKSLLGLLLVLSGLMVFSGYDKNVESYLVDKSPDWLTELTTRF